MRRLLLILVFVAAAFGLPAGAGVQINNSGPVLPPLLPNAQYPIGQAFSGNVPTPSVMIGQRSFIWSTGNGGGPYHISPVPSVSSGGYWPSFLNNPNFNINGNYTNNNGLLWWQSNHPDWIMYKCDEQTPAWAARGLAVTATNGTKNITVTTPDFNRSYLAVGNSVFGVGLPTDGTTITSSSGNTAVLEDNYTGSTGATTMYFGPFLKAVPLDFTLPAVQAFINGFLSQYITAGFAGINWDNVNSNNVSNACGYFFDAEAFATTVVGTSAGGGGAVKVQISPGNASFTTGSAITVVCTSSPSNEANGSFVGTEVDATHVLLQGTTWASNCSAGTASLAIGTPPSYNGTWVQQFTGLDTSTGIDHAWAEAATMYLCSESSYVRTLGGYNIGNTFDVGFAFDDSMNWNENAFSYEQRIGSCFDVMAQESPYLSCKLASVSPPDTSSCIFTTDMAFGRLFTTAQEVTQRQGWWLIEYVPCTTGAESGPYSCVTLGIQPYEAYATAIWLLLRGPSGGTPSYWSPIAFLNEGTASEHAAYVPLGSSWQPAVGNPMGLAYINSGGCYERLYSAGHSMVEVNPSSTTSCTYQAPAGAVDQFGTAIMAGTRTLALKTAVVIVAP